MAGKNVVLDTLPFTKKIDRAEFVNVTDETQKGGISDCLTYEIFKLKMLRMLHFFHCFESVTFGNLGVPFV